MKSETYDVVIIGAGTAGLSARREVAKVTDNYLLIDDGPLGTTCARVGCMPSKVLIEVANLYARRKIMSSVGIEGGEQLALSGKQVMNHVRSLRDRFVRGVRQSMEGWEKTHLLRERAHFGEAGDIIAGNKRIKAGAVIIATGSKPVLPEKWKVFKPWLLDSDSFFELEELPKKMAVIGLGVIGAELGQALARLGVEVTAIGDASSVGGVTDPQMKEYVGRYFAGEFGLLEGRAEELVQQGDRLLVKSSGGSVEVDRALLTMGRRPVLQDLGLEKLGIELKSDGTPEADEGTGLISGSNSIYLAGDATRNRMILHEAADEGRIAGYNAVRESAHCFRKRVRLTITFTAPNVAIAGESFRELTARGADFVTGLASFEGQGRAIVKLAEKGMIRVYIERSSGAILGSEIFAPEGEHLAHLLAWCIEGGTSVFRALSFPFYHPVLEEGLRTALRHGATQVQKKAPDLEALRCQDPPAGS